MTDRPERAPWGFRIVVTLAVAYLLLRVLQIGGWAIDWIV